MRLLMRYCRALLQRKVFQLDLFDEKPMEFEHDRKRYILRCNPDTRKREQARRKDPWEELKAWIQARNEAVEKSSKRKPEELAARGAAALETVPTRLPWRSGGSAMAAGR